MSRVLQSGCMGPTSAFTRIGSSLQSDYLSFRAPLATAVQFHERPFTERVREAQQNVGLASAAALNKSQDPQPIQQWTG